MRSQILLPGIDNGSNGREVRHRTRKQVTFKGGQSEAAHRWFRLTPSFSPDLVRQYCQRFELTSKSLVLDPFAGRGTTPIECKILGIPSVGIEINPFLHFVGNTSLVWDFDMAALTEATENILNESKELAEANQNIEPQDLASRIGVKFPQIHNVFRWWRSDVLHSLLCIKKAVEQVEEEKMRSFFLLALGNILVDVASVTVGRLQLHFIDRTTDLIEPFVFFKESCFRALEDIARLKPLAQTPSAIIHGDSMDLQNVIKKQRFDAVITSPPYPNRYSYVWNTRPHLYFLGLFGAPREATTLDCQTIGGTWGSATTRHMKGEHDYQSAAARSACQEIISEIRSKDNLMANYVAKYFDDLGIHITGLTGILKKGARCAYVVGNSRIKKSVVETDEILARILEECGFEVEEREELRRRNSGKELHETTVVAKFL